MNAITKTLVIGIGATVATDIWSFVLKLFNVHSHGLQMVGNWIFSRLGITLQNQLEGKELLIGYIAHYCLGISFAFLFLIIYGKKSFEKPNIKQALFFGLITFVISLCVIQPVLGFGFAFSKMPGQEIILLKVSIFHTIYSVGLYGSSIVLLTNRTRFKAIINSRYEKK